MKKLPSTHTSISHMKHPNTHYNLQHSPPNLEICLTKELL
ncbi:hypothetical protein CP02DC14_2341 [Chlamydia psittaci 02DC14]|nr:hypothetical protein CP02DC18_1304 [Chlamydia psittaci 02DC18]EPJ17965.1 hypothetical protein CP02DC22_1210 [Chlamydia psittaci 02DC22]EPJ26159.1 hypothetical protein CP03DC29_1361 [Chlamydia psittaci 03DC29]EPL00643.1 hypothetical protein CP02DC14_2341 [Chlamydia psittaci 02DC14]